MSIRILPTANYNDFTGSGKQLMRKSKKLLRALPTRLDRLQRPSNLSTCSLGLFMFLSGTVSYFCLIRPSRDRVQE